MKVAEPETMSSTKLTEVTVRTKLVDAPSPKARTPGMNVPPTFGVPKKLLLQAWSIDKRIVLVPVGT